MRGLRYMYLFPHRPAKNHSFSRTFWYTDPDNIPTQSTYVLYTLLFSKPTQWKYGENFDKNGGMLDASRANIFPNKISFTYIID
jgi:hypothetical protein